MKSRRVFVMLELETDIPAAKLRDRKAWMGAIHEGPIIYQKDARRKEHECEVEQVFVNVAQR